MSFHNNPNYHIPELIEALKARRLPHDTPSQLADSFRIGWTACRELAQQADSVQEDAALQLIADLVRHIDRETCTHEETHRGGAIWEICDSCGSMWADDKGGKPEFKWPDCVEKARAFLDAARKQGASNGR